MKDCLGSKISEVQEIPTPDLRRRLFHGSQHTPLQASQADENHSRALARQERGDGSRDQREVILKRKIEQNKDAMLALWLQQEELEAQMARMIGEQEACSKRRRRPSRSRSPRRDEARNERTRPRSRSREGRS